jgi:phosphatidyl-myo-inositol dimannoside synthase
MAGKILVLTLRTFSATGGIEKVCKLLAKAGTELASESNTGWFKLYSMYDEQHEADERYLPAAMFKGFGQKKIAFAKAAIKEAAANNVIILSHINLLSIGYIIKILFPSTRLVLLAHGIEVWGPLSFARKKMLAHCDRVLAVSEFTKDAVEPFLKNKVAVLNNCLDPYLLPPVVSNRHNDFARQYGLQPDDIVLMTLTRLSSKELYKGYDNVLYVLKEMLPKYPNLKYLLLGKSDEQEHKRLTQIAANCGIANQVVFAGYIQEEDLAKHFSLADIYVMPSKKEGFGIVFIEAMYYGLPVIAGNIDGSADAVCNGALGIMINPDSKEELQAAIQNIITNRQQYLPNRALLMSKFGFNEYKQRLNHLLQQVQKNDE